VFLVGIELLTSRGIDGVHDPDTSQRAIVRSGVFYPPVRTALPKPAGAGSASMNPCRINSPLAPPPDSTQPTR
jgi:hypothetical protein